MSTIDMNQVAGLQAVDAEGNVIGTLSVDDLTNLVANNLVKSTQNQIAAQSVSTLSDATTLAASDEYENTLPVDDNPKSVRTLDAAGNPKQTGINALATVVGELASQVVKRITISNYHGKTISNFKTGLVQDIKGKIVSERFDILTFQIDCGVDILRHFDQDDHVIAASGLGFGVITCAVWDDYYCLRLYSYYKDTKPLDLVVSNSVLQKYIG